MAQATAPFEVRELQGVLIVRARAASLKGLLAERLLEIVFDEFAGDDVVLNLADVDYVDSATMAAVTRIASAKGLCIAALRPTVERMLHTMGLLNLVERRPTEAEALAALREP